MKARYQIVISLSEEDSRKLQELRQNGYQIVDIFRLGLDEAEEKSSKARNAAKKKPDREADGKDGTLF